MEKVNRDSNDHQKRDIQHHKRNVNGERTERLSELDIRCVSEMGCWKDTITRCSEHDRESDRGIQRERSMGMNGDLWLERTQWDTGSVPGSPPEDN